MQKKSLELINLWIKRKGRHKFSWKYRETKIALFFLHSICVSNLVLDVMWITPDVHRHLTVRPTKLLRYKKTSFVKSFYSSSLITLQTWLPSYRSFSSSSASLVSVNKIKFSEKTEWDKFLFSIPQLYQHHKIHFPDVSKFEISKCFLF